MSETMSKYIVFQGGDHSKNVIWVQSSCIMSISIQNPNDNPSMNLMMMISIYGFTFDLARGVHAIFHAITCSLDLTYSYLDQFYISVGS